ncbi:MAG: HAD-IIB family hydrolase [Myxococcales bacterium]|nr:HAD-IIB family hydrolase [Myxococcales bacterium]MCB9709458.1 HAD-IIB family hydrolase [Myxococcales bacterium]
MPTPISELKSSDVQGLEGVLFDIDDTLTRDGRLEAVAYDALWRLYAYDLRLIALTGRPWGFAHVVAQHWPVDIAVAENGACWVAKQGSRLIEGQCDSCPKESNRILAEIQKRVKETLPHVSVTRDHAMRRYDLAFDIGEYATLPEADLLSLENIVEACGATVLKSTVHLHAQPEPWDKAQGACRAAEAVLGLDLMRDREHWMFVGDSPNDAAAFSFFPLSVGVANVAPYLPDLPHPPRFITEADRGSGFAECAHTVISRLAARSD